MARTAGALVADRPPASRGRRGGRSCRWQPPMTASACAAATPSRAPGADASATWRAVAAIARASPAERRDSALGRRMSSARAPLWTRPAATSDVQPRPLGLSASWPTGSSNRRTRSGKSRRRRAISAITRPIPDGSSASQLGYAPTMIRSSAIPSARASSTPSSWSASARPARVAGSDGWPETRSGATTRGPGPIETMRVRPADAAAARRHGRPGCDPGRPRRRRSRPRGRPRRHRPARTPPRPRPPGRRAGGSPCRGARSPAAPRRRRRPRAGAGRARAGCRSVPDRRRRRPRAAHRLRDRSATGGHPGDATRGRRARRRASGPPARGRSAPRPAGDRTRPRPGARPRRGRRRDRAP